MRLRYTLNNATEGEHITTYSPKGWQETELVLKRHEKYEGIFLDYTVNVDFFCGAGKEYIDNIYDTQGIEALVTILIEMDCDDSGTYTTLYDGQLIMKSYEKIQAAPEFTRVNLEQEGIIQTVLNRLETKIDLTKTETLDGDPVTPLTYLPYDLTTHGKGINKIGKFINDPVRHIFTHTTSNIHVIPADIEINEIDQMNYPVDYDFPVVIPHFTNDDTFSRDVTFSGHIRVSELITVNADPPGASPPFITNYAGGFSIVLHLLDVSMTVAGTTIVHVEPATGTLIPIIYEFDITETTLTVPAGYSVAFDYVDTHANTLGTVLGYSGQFDYKDETEFNINDTTVFPDTITKSFAIFETGADIARKITGQADAFRSNFFGRKNSEPFAYDSNGCGSFTAFTNGFLLRGFPISERPLIMSMKEYFDGLNAIHCLGLGLKQEGENTYIEVEPKEYFYRDDEVVLTLQNVRGLTTKIDLRYFFSRFKIGYSTWRKEGLNGLDEFCTSHDYATLLKSVNNELIAQSDFIAGPYAIERQRQERYSDTTSTDQDYDNNNFIIALNRSVDGSDIPNQLDVAEKDENFDNVDNVYSPETIYNLRFSPARIARNWFKILSTSLIKLNDTLRNIKFTFAEGNKTMESEGTEMCDPGNMDLINEGSDIVIEVPSLSGDNPIFTGEIDTIENYPLSFASYSHLKDLDEEGVPNFYKMIRYSTGTDDYLFGFIEEIRYKPITGTANFVFRRAYTQDSDCTHIYVEIGYVECGYVE